MVYEYLRTEHFDPPGDSFVCAYDVMRGPGAEGAEDHEVVVVSAGLMRHLVNLMGAESARDCGAGPDCHNRQGGICRG